MLTVRPKAGGNAESVTTYAGRCSYIQAAALGVVDFPGHRGRRNPGKRVRGQAVLGLRRRQDAGGLCLSERRGIGRRAGNARAGDRPVYGPTEKAARTGAGSVRRAIPTSGRPDS